MTLHLRQVLHCNPVLRINIHKIKNYKENPLQRLHDKICYIAGELVMPDVVCDWESVLVVEITNSPVEARSLFLKHVLKGVSYHELSVYYYVVAVAKSLSHRLYYPFVATGCNSAQIMLVAVQVLRPFLA